MSWRKSSHSDPNECVELAWPAEGGAVRDSKNADGPTLLFSRPGLAALVTAAKAQ
ncbi:DUF397 domain-containing protein [Actinophytocola sp.]|uniref:DUF397 domain-containing protein n=1 Tax=Actinophytocola sp. TaxID=1872138 RepID=UPI00345BACBA